MSTISIGDARSIEAVRGLRRSVSRGSSINALLSGGGGPRPNLPADSWQLQDNLELDDETFFCGIPDVDIVRGVTECAAAAARVHERSRHVGEWRHRGLHRQWRQRWPERQLLGFRQLHQLAVQRIVGEDHWRRGHFVWRRGHVFARTVPISRLGPADFRWSDVRELRCASRHDYSRRDFPRRVGERISSGNRAEWWNRQLRESETRFRWRQAGGWQQYRSIVFGRLGLRLRIRRSNAARIRPGVRHCDP